MQRSHLCSPLDLGNRYAGAGLEAVHSPDTWYFASSSTVKRSPSQLPTSSQVLHHLLCVTEVYLTAGTSPAAALALTLFRGVDSYIATTVLPSHERLHYGVNQRAAKQALAALRADGVVIVRKQVLWLRCRVVVDP